jgi:RNA-directed DNA polymerase
MTAEDSRAVDASAEASGRNSGAAGHGAEAIATTRTRTKAESSGLMEAIVERGNLRLAYQRVIENKGAAGVDGVGIAEFKGHLQRHWPTIRARILTGSTFPRQCAGWTSRSRKAA